MYFLQIIKKWREVPAQSDVPQAQPESQANIPEKPLDIQTRANQILLQTSLCYETKQKTFAEKLPECLHELEMIAPQEEVSSTSPYQEAKIVSPEPEKTEPKIEITSAPNLDPAVQPDEVPVLDAAEASALMDFTSDLEAPIEPQAVEETKMSETPKTSPELRSEAKKVASAKSPTLPQQTTSLAKHPVSQPSTSKPVEDSWDKEMHEFTKGLFEEGESLNPQEVPPSPFWEDANDEAEDEPESPIQDEQFAEEEDEESDEILMPNVPEVNGQEEDSWNLETLLKSLQNKERPPSRNDEGHHKKRRKKNDLDKKNGDKGPARMPSKNGEKNPGKKRYKWV